MFERAHIAIAPSRGISGLLLFSGIILASLLVSPLHQTMPSLCIIKRILGIPCPGCGMTRAFLYLGHGDWRKAMELNINSLFVFAFVVVFWLRSVVRAVTLRDVRIRLKTREVHCILLLGGIAIATSWVYNIVFNPWL